MDCRLWDGEALEDLGRFEEANIAYEEVITRYGDLSDPDLDLWVARAMVGRGTALLWLGRFDESIIDFDEMTTRYGDTFEFGVRTQVLISLVFKAGALEELGRLEEAIAVYEDAVTLYGDTSDPYLAGIVSMAEARLDDLTGR